MSEAAKPQRNSDFSWTVQRINDEYWYFDFLGFPVGPFASYDIAIDELDFYSYNWDIENDIEEEI